MLSLVLLATAAALTMGVFLKHPCVPEMVHSGTSTLCYTDISTLYHVQELNRGRLPYLEDCVDPGSLCDEYPTLLMYTMRGVAAVSWDTWSFYAMNVAILAMAGFVVTGLLVRMTGRRAFLFALSPILVLTAFLNWDLLAVALAVGAASAVRVRRAVLAGILLGLGAALKLFPLLMLLPLALHLRRRGSPEKVMPFLLACGATLLAVNLPFAVAGTEGWLTFYRFSIQRPVDVTSLWYPVCGPSPTALACPPRLLTVLSLGVFVGGVLLVLLSRRARTEEDHLHLILPFLLVFLLTNKVHSPQYSLWVLPWLIYSIRPRWITAFLVVDAAAFVTLFLWFGELGRSTGRPIYADLIGVPLVAFQLAQGARALVMAGILRAWIRGGRKQPPSPVRVGDRRPG